MNTRTSSAVALILCGFVLALVGCSDSAEPLVGSADYPSYETLESAVSEAELVVEVEYVRSADDLRKAIDAAHS